MARAAPCATGVPVTLLAVPFHLQFALLEDIKTRLEAATLTPLKLSTELAKLRKACQEVCGACFALWLVDYVMHLL